MKKTLLKIMLAYVMVFSIHLFASDSMVHKVVIQVSTDDVKTQKIALNNASNLQKLYGIDNIQVEIVAYGPGLSILTKNSPHAKRVESMAMGDISFRACGNTMKKITKKTGKNPLLSDGVTVVSSGVGKIVELQEHGYVYIRP